MILLQKSITNDFATGNNFFSNGLKIKRKGIVGGPELNASGRKKNKYYIIIVNYW